MAIGSLVNYIKIDGSSGQGYLKDYDVKTSLLHILDIDSGKLSLLSESFSKPTKVS